MRSRLMPVIGLVAVGLLASGLAGRACAQGQSAVMQQKITINAENSDIRAVLKALFGSVHVEYVLAPEVQGKITVSLTDIPFRIALEAVLRSVESTAAYTYRVEDGIYYVVVKPEPPPSDPAKPAVGAGDKRVTTSIELKHADAAQIAAIVGDLSIAPDTLILAGDTSAFGPGYGSGRAAHWVHTYQPPDGTNAIYQWSFGTGNRGGTNTGGAGGLTWGGLGRGGLGGLGPLGRLFH